MGIGRGFVEYSAQKIRDHHWQIGRCSRMLSLEQLWFRPNGHSNSVGNLLLHLRGNISQWILTGLAGQAYDRHRQAEFDHRETIPHDQVLGDLDAAVEAVTQVISTRTEEELTREYLIQKYRVTGLQAIYHVVEHYAFHAGQIVTTTKWLLDVDVSLYDERGQRRDGRTSAVP